MVGGWPGLFFDDDAGYMTNELMFTLLGVNGGGYNTTYPIEYESKYVDSKEYQISAADGAKSLVTAGSAITAASILVFDCL